MRCSQSSDFSSDLWNTMIAANISSCFSHPTVLCRYHLSRLFIFLSREFVQGKIKFVYRLFLFYSYILTDLLLCLCFRIISHEPHMIKFLKSSCNAQVKMLYSFIFRMILLIDFLEGSYLTSVHFS